MLDPDAARVWHAITVHGGIAGLADEIAASTAQDPRVVGVRITAFVDALVENGVLVDAAGASRRKWWRR
jgi:hypothetical protein